MTVKSVITARAFVARVEHQLVSFAKDQLVEGRLAHYLHVTGAPVEVVDTDDDVTEPPNVAETPSDGQADGTETEQSGDAPSEPTSDETSAETTAE